MVAPCPYSRTAFLLADARWPQLSESSNASGRLQELAAGPQSRDGEEQLPGPLGCRGDCPRAFDSLAGADERVCFQARGEPGT